MSNVLDFLHKAALQSKAGSSPRIFSTTESGAARLAKAFAVAALVTGTFASQAEASSHGMRVYCHPLVRQYSAHCDPSRMGTTVTSNSANQANGLARVATSGARAVETFGNSSSLSGRIGGLSGAISALGSLATSSARGNDSISQQQRQAVSTETRLNNQLDNMVSRGGSERELQMPEGCNLQPGGAPADPRLMNQVQQTEARTNVQFEHFMAQRGNPDWRNFPTPVGCAVQSEPAEPGFASN